MQVENIYNLKKKKEKEKRKEKEKKKKEIYNTWLRKLSNYEIISKLIKKKGTKGCTGFGKNAVKKNQSERYELFFNCY